MKTLLKISLILNLALIASLIFLVSNLHKPAAVLAPGLTKVGLIVKRAAAAESPAAETQKEPFRWSQLESSRDYQTYIANLRAVGCPESTVENIVRGDADQAFSWERSRLGLDGAGTGPWSQYREMQLIASLLGKQSPAVTISLARNTQQPAAAGNGGDIAHLADSSPTETEGSPSYPLFLQNVDWSAMGFTPQQQSAIARVRQQFQTETASLNQSGDAASNRSPATSPGVAASNSNAGSSDSAAVTQLQQAYQDADEQLRESLGGQGYMAYEQQQYDAWFRSQVAAAAGGPLTINPAAFH